MDTFETTIQCRVARLDEAGGTPTEDVTVLLRATTPDRRVPLSEILWGIRWTDILPRPLGEDLTVVASSAEQAQPFIEAHYATVFEDTGDGRFLKPSAAALRARYYHVVGDFFEFRHGTRTVALLIATPSDWSTYYIRSIAALPEFQGKQIVQRFMPHFFAVLKAAGVERVEAHTSPSNMAMMQVMLRFRFNPSGTVLTDRWGALLKFTRFLDDQAEQVFIDQFCTGVHYQLKSNPGSRRASVSGVEAMKKFALICN